MRRRSAWARFQKLYRVTPSGCWAWIGSHDKDGYGRFKLDGKNVQAHRFSYEHHKGEIPFGFDVHHICEFRDCVNPDCLDAIEPAENKRFAREKPIPETPDDAPW